MTLKDNFFLNAALGFIISSIYEEAIIIKKKKVKKKKAEFYKTGTVIGKKKQTEIRKL